MNLMFSDHFCICPLERKALAHCKYTKVTNYTFLNTVALNFEDNLSIVEAITFIGLFYLSNKQINNKINSIS